MSNTISCVILVSGVYVGSINNYLEALGYGPDNISVPLLDASDNPWFGSHTWCEQAFIDQLEAYPDYDKLVVSAIVDAVPRENWNAALTANALHAPPVEDI